ncbi:MAG: hypothetical protein CVV16_03305 [Gammaproteobacteria bacterium HGW-Gammaproteobacteria-6]|nr:MAG: hypothetical protein CVV16_03305 [Gammaproteobacteria bacterium HGW-Gammaproteobacteria-6]
MVPFETFVVGRSPDADLVLSDPSISRRQIEITLTSDHRYFVTDCLSSSGTRVQRSGNWQTLTQDFVEPNELLSMGNTQYLLSDLLTRLPRTRPSQPEQPEPVSVRPRRKSDTGEVVIAEQRGN